MQYKTKTKLEKSNYGQGGLMMIKLITRTMHRKSQGEKSNLISRSM